MAMETVKVPDLGGVEDVEVIEIAVSVGDSVAEEDTLLVLESDKASMDVPSPVAGVVKKVLVKLGDKVSEASPIVEVERAGAGESDSSSSGDAGDDNSKDEEASSRTESSGPEKDDGQPEERSDKKPPPGDEAPRPGGSDRGQSAEQPLKLPDLGTGDAVDVIEIAVAEGDSVAEGDALMTLEGDKATMDVPSPVAGKILSLSVSVGDKVTSGQDIGRIQVETATATPESAKSTGNAGEGDADDAVSPAAAGDGDKAPAPESPRSAEDSETEPARSLDEPEAPPSQVYAGPVVRQFARELGIDLRNVEGTGLKGRIQKDDVRQYVKSALSSMESGGRGGAAIPAIADQDFSQFGEVEEVQLHKIGRLTATNMHRVWLNVPMVTQFDDADITDLEAFRKSLKPEAEKRGVKLTPLAFLVKACATVLVNNPVLNRSWHSSGEKVVQKHYVHIGMAVDTDKGLVVPVIRDVDKKGIFEIAEAIGLLADKARAGKLSPADMQGGCFSISSLGAIGGRGFTPIVNAPEAAILGVSRAAIQPVWNGEAFEPRQLLPLSLTYDHKLVNGADAGRFLTELVAVIGDIRRLLL